MPLKDIESWMWIEACDMLDRVDRLHRQFSRPTFLNAKGGPCWEPPVDVYETRYKYVIMIALPGVEPEQVSVSLEDGHLIVKGQRRLAIDAETHIRRLEIPYGRFERSIELPSGQYEVKARNFAHGCLFISLRRI